MVWLITGAAGFIGFHASRFLLQRGEAVIGVDNLNDYYDPQLKRDRLAALNALNTEAGFEFAEVDLADLDGLRRVVAGKGVRKVIHLAAQAGVRHSIENPHAYAQSNLVGHLNILELCRHLDGLEHLSYASSSSVYGGNTKLPFSETDAVDQPVSLYAATKKADELMSQAYAHLYRMPTTGFRFFTVYGPWGRPDMAMWLFADAIHEGRPITVFNNGDMQRDFTFIDDIIAGLIAASDSPPIDDGENAPHRIYNIGNNKPERLMDMVVLLEKAMGKAAIIEKAPMQPGDMLATYADISAISRDHGFAPTTSLEDSVAAFVGWFKDYKKIN
jgi:UDP-glucuronate 4-epimerase